MTVALVVDELRLRARLTAAVGLSLFAMALVVTALFPSLRDSVGDIGDNLPSGVADLIGGGDYGTLPGWLKGEIFSVVAPFGLAGLGIAVAVTGSTSDEEAGVLDLTLAYPVRRAAIIGAAALTAALAILMAAVALWAGLLIGVVAFTDDGLGAGALAAALLHTALLGVVFATLALAVGAVTSHRSTVLGVSIGALSSTYLLNGFASAVGSLEWLRRLSPFYYDSGSDPLSNGIALGHVAVLAGLALLLTAFATVAFDRRDLRG